MFEHKQFSDYPSDLTVIYCVVMLLSWSVDIEDRNELDIKSLDGFILF